MRRNQAQPQTTSWIRSRVVRTGVAALSIGALAVGLAGQATRSSSAAPVPQIGVGRLDLGALNDRDNGVSRDSARVATPQVIAQSRANALAQTAKELAAQRQANALEERTESLDATVDQIEQQSERLNDASSFLMPTAGKFGSGFGMRLHPILHYWRMHNGQDIGGTCGQPIWAAQDGTVIKVAPNGYNGGSGHNVRIDGGEVGGVNLQTAYLHMDTIAVQVGQKVHKGELLGTVGNTGISTACHLHFSVYVNGKGVDPVPYLKNS